MRAGFRPKAVPAALFALIVCMGIVPLRPEAATAGQNSGASAGKISALVPVDYVVRGPQSLDAARDMAILWGDAIRTERGGRVRVRLDDGSLLNLGSETTLTINSHEAALQRTRVDLMLGSMRAHAVRFAKAPVDFQVRTKVAVAGVVGTEFYVETSATLTTVIALEGGRVRVQSLDPRFPDAVLLEPGEVISLTAGERPGAKRRATVEELTRAVAESTADALDGLTNRVVTTSSGVLRLANGVAVDAVLSKSLDAKRAKAGDVVEAKVASNVKSAGAVAIPRGAKLLGRVTTVLAKSKERAESHVGIEFERAVLKDGREVPLQLALQAVAAPALATGDAATDFQNSASAAAGTSPRPRGSAAGGLTSAAGGAVASATQAAGSAAQSATRVTPPGSLDAAGAARSTTRVSTGSGLPGISLQTDTSTSARGSVLTSQKGNVRLESGTRLRFSVITPAQ